MKLTNLIKTLRTCKAYQSHKGNETRVKQIEEHIERVNINHLVSPDDKKINGMYLGQTKADV